MKALETHAPAPNFEGQSDLPHPSYRADQHSARQLVVDGARGTICSATVRGRRDAPVAASPTLQPAPTVAHPDLDHDIEDEYDPENQAHIVKVAPGESAAALVLEARINGTAIEALCGHRWVPNRNPENLPLCNRCKDIYETYRMFNQDLGDSPSA